MPQPGASPACPGTAFNSLQRRLCCPRLACGQEGYQAPWLLLTDLPPNASEAAWSGLRAWIELPCNCLTRAGWPWQRTRMTQPDRAARGDLQRRVDRCLASQHLNAHGRHLQKRGAKIEAHLCPFLDEATILPTHNLSEQAIRLISVFRNVTNGFRSDWGRNLFATLRSVVNTRKCYGLSAFQAIQKTLSPMGSLFDPG